MKLSSECFFTTTNSIISPPHIHAEYQGAVAVFSIADGQVLEGAIRDSKKKLVIAWIEIHKDELLADWQLAVEGSVPFKIRGLE